MATAVYHVKQTFTRLNAKYLQCDFFAGTSTFVAASFSTLK